MLGSLSQGADEITLGSVNGEPVTVTWNNHSFSVITHDKNNVTIAANYWWFPAGAMELDSPIAFDSSSPEATLKFSFDCTGSSNGTFAVTLIGSEKMIVIGNKGYNDSSIMADYVTHGTCEKTGDHYGQPLQAGSFVGSNTDITDRIQVCSQASSTAITLSADTSVTISRLTSYDGSEYVLELNVGEESGTLKLGSAFSLESIAFTGAAQTALKIDNINIEATPEPATGTLSLLALAGLAARRRRH